ncbi:MAG: hypothetical protein L0Z62_41500 [Gemmataceae bacterium]|nr:hypothetical protein [Gemmataceae bacterium]
MRNRWVLFALLLGLGLGLSALSHQNVNAGDSERITKLVSQLGSSKFTERDKAKRELEALGEAALPALRKAVQSGDLETSRRAGELVKRLEQKITLDNLLAPKKLRLNVKDVPVPEAVAQLAKLSGYRIELMGDRAAMANRKVTLDTGETTFWQALDQLCDKAGLVETAINPYGNPRPQPPIRIQPIQVQPIQIKPIQIRPVPAQPAPQPAPAQPGAQPAQPKPRPAPLNNVQPGALQLQIDVPNVGAVPVQIELPALPAQPAQNGGAAPAQPAPMDKVAPQGQGQVQPGRAIQVKAAQVQKVQKAVQKLQQARPIQIQPGVQPAIAPAVQPFNPGQINLTEGKRVEVPTHYAGAIRIRVYRGAQTNPQVDPRLPQVLPNGLPAVAPQRREGEAIILLEVSAEPRLQNVQVTGEVQVGKAIDDQGQKLTVPMDPMRPGVNQLEQLGGRVMINRAYYYNPYASNNIAVVRLKLGEKKAKTLKELSGHVPVQVLTPPEALITVEDVLKAKGKSVKGQHGGMIEVIAIEKQGDGTYKVQFRFESPANHVATPFGGMALVAPNGAVQIQQIQIQINGRPVTTTRAAGNGLPVLVDAKGKPFQLAGITNRAFRGGVNGVATQELTMIFRPEDGQGEPARFVLTGQRPVTVQVPFTLQNVQLP